MFLKLLLFDIRNGWKVNGRKYIVVLTIFAVLPIILLLIINRNRLFAPETFAASPTLGDCLLYTFVGIKPYVYDPRIPFSFPAQWILLILLLLYPSLDFVKAGMRGIGLQVLVRVENKRKWWISKQLWLLLSIVVSYYLVIGVILLFGLIIGCKPSFQISSYMAMVVPVSIDTHQVIGFTDYAMLFLVGFPLCLVALAEIQLLVSIVFSSVISFIVMISYLFFSAYFTFPLLIGNYAMFSRNKLFIQNGLSCSWGILICGMVIPFSVLLGWKVIRHKDFF